MPKNTRPVSQTILQWQPSIATSWSLSEIKSAIRQHMAGNLARSAQLLRSMGEDDEIPADLNKMADCVLKSPFTLECDDETIQKATESVIKDILPDAQLKEILKQKFALGVSVGTIDWDLSGSLWVPRLRFLDPEFLYHDTGLRVWKYMSREGLIQVTPGDGTWFLHIDCEYGYYDAAVRPLGPLWYFKQSTFRDWNRYNERHGLPIIKAKVPITGHATDKDDFVDDIQNMGSEGVVALPQDENEFNSYDLDLLETKDQSWKTFQSALDRADRKVQIICLGGNLSTEVASSGANRAASETHSDQLDRIKAAAIAQRLSEDLQNQVLAKFVELNFGQGRPVPYPCWETEPPEDRNKKSTAVKDFSTALTTLSGAGFTVKNLEEVALEYGLELEFKQPETPEVEPIAKKLASGHEAMGAIEGVEFADEIADEVGARATDAMRPDVKTLVAMVRAATSYPDLDNRIRVAFNQVDPSRLADILEQGMTLAQLDGRYAVAQDVATEQAR